MRIPERTLNLLLFGSVMLAALCARVARLPPPSPVFPGRLTFSSSWLALDPPSMDELWHVALTTGRGSPLGGDLYQRDELLQAVPSLTSLRDAPPCRRVWGTLDDVLHPPLFILTLRWWRQLLGEGDIVPISYSLFWSLVCVGFVFAAAAAAAGRGTAFWAALLMALAPVPLYISQEIRGYSMVCGLSALTLYVLVRAQKNGLSPPRLVALAFLIPALFLSHYFTATVCLAAACTAVILAKPSLRIRAAAVFLVCGLLVATAWGPSFLRQVTASLETGDSWLKSGRPMPCVLIRQTALLPIRLLVEGSYGGHWQVAVSCVLLIAPCAASVRFAPLRPFVVWTLAAVGLVLGMDLVRQTRHLTVIRYASVAMPALAVAMIAWPSGLPDRVPAVVRRTAVHVTGLALVLFSLASWKQVVRYDSPNTLAIAEIASGCMGTKDAILITARGGVSGFDRSILLSLSHLPGLFPRDVVLLSRPMDEGLVRKLAGRSAVLISAGTDEERLDYVPGAVPAGQARVVKDALWCRRVRFPGNEGSEILAPEG